MFTNIKDAIIRKIATSFLLKYVDGYKTEIMRIVHAVNIALLALVTVCQTIPTLPTISGVAACGVVVMLNAKWIMLGTVLSHFGLEFGIQDANAKKRQGKE